MMSAKITTVGLIEVMVFRKKVYNFINCVHDVTNKILSRGLNYIVDLVM